MKTPFQMLQVQRLTGLQERKLQGYNHVKLQIAFIVYGKRKYAAIHNKMTTTYYKYQ